MSNSENLAINRLKEINNKNSETKGYSLGDVLIMDKYEKILRDCGWNKKDIAALSENYYKNTKF
jgi:hypothetical protein